MYHQMFFGATCVGILMAAGLMPLPDRENLPAAVADFDISEVPLPDQEEVLARLNAVVDGVSEMSLPDQEEVLAKLNAVVDGVSEMKLPDKEEVLAKIDAVVDELPEYRERVEEGVVRPGIEKFLAALKSRSAKSAKPEAPKTEAIAQVVNFDLDTAELDENAKEQLDALARVLEKNPAATLGIYGHTDLTGDETYNMALGQLRAEQVAAYLTANGIEASRINLVKSYGESSPSVETDRPLRDNRRVNIELM